MTPDEYEDFRRDCYEELVQKNQAWRDEFGGFARWDYDDPNQLLVFSDGGLPKVLCTYQSVGSFSSRSNTWMWSWTNPTITPASWERMVEVREFGKTHGITELSEPKFDASPEDGWTLAAVARRLLNAQAVYRPPSDHLLIFLLIMSTRRIDA